MRKLNQQGFVQLLIILLVLAVLAGAAIFLITKYPNLLTKFNFTEVKKVILSKEEKPAPTLIPSVNPQEVKKANEEYFLRQQQNPHPPLYNPNQ